MPLSDILSRAHNHLFHSVIDAFATQHGRTIVVYSIAGLYSPSFTTLSSLIASNIAGPTKRTTVNAVNYTVTSS